MRPVRLELAGFLSYHEPVTLDLGDVHAGVILGPNGSGKSSIIEGMTWALFGKGRGRGPDDFVSTGAGYCRVAFEFEVGGRLYGVQRERDRGGKGKSDLRLAQLAPDATTWHALGGESIAETQEKIIDLLGFDYEAWTATSLIAQGKAAAFTGLSPADRKRLLFDMLGLGAYEDAATVARETARGVEGELLTLRDLVARSEAVVAGRAEAEERYTRAMNAVFGMTGAVGEAEAALHEAEAEALAGIDVRRDLAAAEAGWETERYHADDRVAETSRQVRLASAHHERITVVATEAAAALARMTPATCPTCGQSIDAETFDRLVDDQEAKVRTFREDVAHAREELAEAKEDLRVAALAHDALAAVPVELVALRRAVAELPPPPDTAKLRADLDSATRSYHDAMRAEVGAKAEVQRLEAVDAELVTARLTLEAAERRLAIEQLCARMLGKDGIPALVLESAVPEIEAEANRILDALDGRFAVRLSTLRTTKTAGLRETLDIDVYDGATSRDLGSFSAGEQDCINLAIRVAIAELNARRSGTPVRTLVVDDVFGTLDGEHLQAVLAVLHSLAERFECILVCTHLGQLAEAFPTVIRVAAGAGGSRVEIERSA